MDFLGSKVEPGETFWHGIFEAQNKGEGPIKTDYPLRNDFVHWENLRHPSGGFTEGKAPDSEKILPTGAVRIRQAPSFEKGLHTTRFRRGFQRRRQGHIRQDEARLEKEARKEQNSLAHGVRRRQRLRCLDKRNGFNVITGQFDPTNRRCTTPFHVQPRTREMGLLSEVPERAEYVLLRDSEYKFHAPAWSGENHNRRQDLLLREGLNKPKKSSLLGIGTADLLSAGVEDAFSKAIYDPAKACDREGLVEISIPGRYTPRKIAARSPHGSNRWPFSSVAAMGNVFRVVPNGINGYSDTLPYRTGASIHGIAPPKRLSGLKSALTLRQRQKAPDLLSPVTGQLSLDENNGSSHSGSGNTPDTGEPSKISRLASVDEVQVLPDVTVGGGCFDDGRHGFNRCGRGKGLRLSSSQPELDTITTSSASARVRAPATRSFLKTSASDGCLQTTGWPSALARTASPAQRRDANQLALDFAAVRSLDL